MYMIIYLSNYTSSPHKLKFLKASHKSCMFINIRRMANGGNILAIPRCNKYQTNGKRREYFSHTSL